ncbi:Signal transduction histidine kinase [Flavobacterium fluvii]|uniref:histidine kinase n=1 Tax=Flavobacterium fluvii TaxID=468056 RepID=A0A1M5PU56_9FLAO|nr:sensor histidine kinase [Flavobacterium fluvii]SHH05242.1 Signal transduction histidine kinase [Flavobacterium fluvii]
MEEKNIREELSKILVDDPTNYSQIIELSSKLASFDTENVRFSVDASVIDRLGTELVARHETAVSELIKNSYDADAKSASLNFINVNSIGGTLIIDDNGNGMTRNQLVNGFMKISSTSKIHEPESPLYKRKRAGKKGIGRFSTQRLGNKLTIITQTLDSEFALKVIVDWNKYKRDGDLIFITNTIEEVNKTKDKGTTLIIEDLREWWSDSMIKRVYRYAIDILQPFPLVEIESDDISEIKDPGFEISCMKNDFYVADQHSMFYEHAVAVIEGHIDENGRAYWEIKNSRIPNTKTGSHQYFSKEDKIDNIKFDYLKNVRLRAYYYIFNVGLIPKQSESYIKSISEEYGGIRLYRNGFRVLPYGESQNDWLGLDESVRKRKILAVHGNNNFFGFVEIGGQNHNFDELSSREGLFRNDAYEELVTFSYKTITSAVTRIASSRGIKVTTDQKDWDKQYSRNPKDTILDTADELDKIADELEASENKKSSEESNNNNNKNDTDNNKEEGKEKERAEEFRKKAQQLRQAIESIDELNMIRVLAGLGLIIGEFTHEITNYLGAFDVDIQYIIDNIDKSKEEYKRAIRLKSTFDSFQVYTSYFDETISQNVNQELKPIEIRDVIKPFVKTISPDTERCNINLELDINGYELFTCKMHTSEWASILFNLYSNSKKAIKRANQTNGKVLIRAGKENEYIFVEFIDDGDGIPLENRDKVFNAFFTTSSPKGHKSTSTDDLTGTGLGLKIVKDIIESYNGEITIDNSPEGFKTNFRIIIPIATQEEIKEYEI